MYLKEGSQASALHQPEKLNCTLSPQISTRSDVIFMKHVLIISVQFAFLMAPARKTTSESPDVSEIPLEAGGGLKDFTPRAPWQALAGFRTLTPALYGALV